MRFVCDHEAICRALGLVGVGEVYVISRLPLDEVGQWETKDVAFVAWSPLQTLVRRPENSLASVPGVTFLRLPISLAALTGSRTARNPRASAPVRADLCVPLGQFTCSLHRLLGLLPTETPGEVLARVAELRRFCASHWPGWFESALDIVRNSLQQRDPTNAGELVKVLLEFSGQVATYEAFRAFLHGAGKDIVNAGPGPVNAALSYYLSGGLEYQDVLETLEGDRWWSAFAEEFAKIEQGLQGIGLSGFDPDMVLGKRVDTARQSLAGFAECAERLLRAPRGRKVTGRLRPRLEEAQRCLEVLMNTIQAIAREREKLRQRVHQRVEHAATAVR